MNYRFQHTKAIALCIIMSAISIIAFAQTTTETLPTGAFIINMGVVPQTQNNALKPYGLIWDLIHNNHVQVKWVISQSKAKDGIDFTYNSVDYKGGTFIIPQKYLSAAVLAKIGALYPSAITGAYTTSPLTVDVNYTLKYTPRWTFDFANGSIAQAYLTAAGIPIANFPKKTPDQLNDCDDLFVMPHADPTWATHKNLYYWNQNSRGWIWAACHAVSAMENIYNPADPTQELNFLCTNFSGFGADQNTTNDWAGNSLVLYSSHSNPSTPFTYANPNDAEMQFMGLVDGGVGANGSEEAYMPYNAATGGAAGRISAWRATTKISVMDASPAATNPNVPENSNGPVGEVVYGRAFGNTNYGSVMYEAGHNHGGTSTAFIAAQRIFFNFSFLSVYDKDPVAVTAGPTNINSGNANTYHVTLAKAGYSLSDYAIQWTSTCGGTFSRPFDSLTTFTPAAVATCGACVLTVTLTDPCGRQFYETVDLTVCPAPPVALDRTSNMINNLPGTTAQPVCAAVPLGGTDPDGTVVSYTVTTLPIAAQGVLYYDNDGNTGTPDIILPVNTVLTAVQAASIKFDPADGFGGNATFLYTVTDNSGLSDATPATYSIPVNPPPAAQNILTTPINSDAGQTPITPALNATDDGTIISYTITALPPAPQGILYLNGVTVTVGQVLTPAQAAQLSFDPSGTFIGYAIFTYTATDNNNATDPTPATVTVQIVNLPPLARDVTAQSINNANGTGQTAIPALSATDSDGTIATYTITSLPQVSEGVLYYFNGTAYVEVSGGQVLTPAQAAGLKFDPADGFSGNSTFTYTATDNNGLIDNTPATYNLPVGIIPPIATDIINPAIYSGAGQTALSVLSGNDPDATNIISAYIITILPPASGGILYYNNGSGYVPVVAGASLTPAQMTGLKFDPTDGATGNVVFYYSVTDDESLPDLSSASFTIPLMNIPPNAKTVNNAAMNSSDGPTTISPLDVTDADGTVVSYTVTTLPDAAQGILMLSGVPVYKGRVLSPAQITSLQFDPAPGSTGTATFTYTATDDQGATDATPATFFIPINNVSQPPVADDKTNPGIAINANATGILPLTGSDADGIVVNFTVTVLPPAAQGTLYLYGVPVNAGQVISLPSATQLTFKPTGTYTGNVVFNYTTTDNSGLTDATPAVFTIPVSNTPPVAQDISIPQVKTSTTVKLPPLNATDADGTVVSYTILTLPNLGTLQVDLTGTGTTWTALTAGQVLTTAQAARLRKLTGGTQGTSVFTYTATDNNSAVDATPATYTIPIGSSAALQPPTAYDKYNAAINASAGLTNTLALSATDPDGTIVNFTILSVPPPYAGTLYYMKGGTVQTVITDGGTLLTLAEGSTMRYDPSGLYTGNVSFTYTAIDDDGNVDMTGATYMISLINTPPVATDINNAAIPSSAGPTTISSFAATDADGTIADYMITALPAATQGVLFLDGVPVTEAQIISTAQAARLQFDPASTYSGTATFTYTAIDNLNSLDQTPATFTIPVTNQPPVADDKLSQIITNQVGTGQQPIPAFTATDNDGSIASFTIKTLPSGGILYVNSIAATVNMVITPAQALQLSFDPNDGFSGTASFTYTATDNSVLVDATPASYQVPVNTPPTTNDITVPAMYAGDVNTALTAFTGADDGFIQFYSITKLPPASQGTVYLNGVPVTDIAQADTLTALQITQLSFTPAAGFTGTTFTYTATDNIGVIDVSPAVYTIPQKIIISGNVWNDVSGNKIIDGTEAGINGTNSGGGTVTGAVLYANLLDAANIVLATSAVQPDGSYNFGYARPNTKQTVQLSLNQGTVSSSKPATILPIGWVNTGENKNGLGGLPDNLVDGEIILNTTNANATTQNFGIERLPESAVSNNINGANPNGFNNTTVPGSYFVNSNVGVNPNTLDYSGGTVNSIHITAFPANTNTITLNGVTYITTGTCSGSCTAWPAGGVTVPFTDGTGPTQPILIDPIDGMVTIVIPFAAIDNAGFEDPTPGSVTLSYNSLVAVSLLNFTATPEDSHVKLQWSMADQSGVIKYEAEFSANGHDFTTIADRVVNSTASYTADHLNPVKGMNWYRIKITEQNGRIHYSEIRKVNFDKVGIITVYPNPTKDLVNISLSGSMLSKAATISIYSAEGRQVYQKRTTAIGQTETIDLGRFPAGHYIIKVLTDTETISRIIELTR